MTKYPAMPLDIKLQSFKYVTVYSMPQGIIKDIVQCFMMVKIESDKDIRRGDIEVCLTLFQAGNFFTF